MTSRVQRLVFATVAVLLGLAAIPVLAQSQTDALPEAPRLSVSQPANGGAKGHLTVSATLTTQAGKALSGELINFYQQTDLFGPRDALLGTATTDSSGYAAIDYQPAQTGSQVIKVRFSGDVHTAAADASRTIQVRDVIPPYTPDPLPLAQIRQWLPLGLASLVLGTWAVLLGVSLRTVLGIRAARAARKDEISLLAYAHEALERTES